MTGQVIAVASGKGGVGKTTTVTNLGVVLRRSNYSVALVDADLGMANLGPMLGITSDPTLHDVLAGTASLEEALVTETTGFAVLPGSETLTDFSDADPRGLGTVLESLAEDYDFVLVDTGAGISHEGVLPLGLADRVLLVTSPDPAAVENTRKTSELVRMAEGLIAGVLVTKADETIDVEEVAARIGVDLLGVVPFDPTVRRSTAAGKPLEAVDPDSPAAAGYREVASALTAEPTEPPEATGGPDTAASSQGGRSDATGDQAEASEPEPAAAGGSADDHDETAPDPAEDGSVDTQRASSETSDEQPVDATADADDSAPDSPPTDEPATDSQNAPPAATAGDEVDTEATADEGADETAEDESPPPAPDGPRDRPDRQESEQRGGFIGWLGRLFR